MFGRTRHDGPTSDDDWEGQPGQGPFYQWILGVALPLVLMVWGAFALVTQHAYLAGRIPMTVNGISAVAVGVAALSAALFIHCHYFWGNIYDQVWYAVLGKIIGLCGFIGATAIFIVRMFLFGR